MIEEGKVYAYNYGANITAYRFYKCIRTTDKNAWLIELGKTTTRSADGGYYQQFFVKCNYEPVSNDVKRVSRNKYIGSEYKGEELYEDHMD